ncbi:MAG: hypothetical protein ACFFD4_32505 [Candidatus Odinarchaeota archaeon]
MKGEDCWKLLAGNFRTPVITCELSIYSHLTSKWHQLEPVVVDTGYDGDVLLAHGVYQDLGFGFSELPSSAFDKVGLVDGTSIILRSSITKINWANQEHEVRVEAVEGNEETLAGRGLLLRASNHYDHETREFCVVRL